MNAKYPKSLSEAIRHFSDFENCRRFMVEIRWADAKVRCPMCGAANVTYLENARLWKCYGKHNRAKFSLKVGTIFEDSAIQLEKWLPAMWLIANCKNGISSYELANDLSVTQKTAWFMLHRIRLAMQAGSLEKKFMGGVEIDETYIGGKARFMHKDKHSKKIRGRGGMDKAAVVGLLDRTSGKVRLKHVPNTNSFTLRDEVRANVERGSEIFTGEFQGYAALDKEYIHNVINHAEAYARGNVTTNRIENFWSLLKRGIRGTYVSVEPFHLFRYLDEQAFRFNNRKASSTERFTEALRSITGRRLRYKELIGETLPPPAPLSA